jgi:hypothetical protein
MTNLSEQSEKVLALHGRSITDGFPKTIHLTGGFDGHENRPYDISLGEKVLFAFVAKAPDAPGVYCPESDMLQEMVTWFR